MTSNIFLLDTNIVSETQKRRFGPELMRWLHENWPVAIPYPVILEVRFGILQRQRDDPAGAAKLRLWYDALLETEPEFPAMTMGIAERQAQMMEVPYLKNLWINQSPKGRRPPGQDLCIAAIAIEHQMPIATLNTKDFLQINQYFPLPGVLDPVSGVWAVQPIAEPQSELHSRGLV